MFKLRNLIDPKYIRSLPKKLAGLRVGLTVGLIFFIAGLIIIGADLFGTWRSQQTNAASQNASDAFASGNVNGSPTISGVPVRIIVPSLDIDLKVIPGYYYPATKSWTLTRDSAQFAVVSAMPNDKKGLTFIYGHYRRGVFIQLPKIQVGATAIIKTENKHTFEYTFRASTVLAPDDTSVFKYQGKPILVLQTCTGVHFQNRQLFVFDLRQVD
jgi:LPXTG-site transpeptidase (sortase) family protein